MTTLAQPDPAWEAAYRRFETPAAEVRKFTARLRRLGVLAWPRYAAIAELFCGRGNGLVALERLGFTRLTGVDLSPALLADYDGPAACVAADARALPFDDGSFDVVIIQGGLHHLERLPDDLDLVLAEVVRVLGPDGRFVAVEPWTTPFLTAAHTACRCAPLRAAWPKMDALAGMIERERTTYDAWLGRPELVRKSLAAPFGAVKSWTARGKLYFEGRKPRA